MSQGKTTLLLALSSFLAIGVACSVGVTDITLFRVLNILVKPDTSIDSLILWEIRLPRTLAAYLVGACLAASGAALQGLLRNPLAEPGVLGVSAWSSLAAVTVIYFSLAESWSYAVPLAAITGSLVVTGLLCIIAMRVRSTVTLILFGIGLSSLAGSLMALVTNFAPNPFYLSDMITWMLGSVANRSLLDVAIVLPFMMAGLLLLLSQRKGLALLSLGEDTASTLGLNLTTTRICVVLGAGLATGAAVSLAGVIGFVGIVIPHIVRPLVNYDPGETIIPSALLGEVFLVLIDIGVRVISTNIELKIGVLSALIGAPIFIWIASRRSQSG
jgi:iron complex transport system permease protein